VWFNLISGISGINNDKTKVSTLWGNSDSPVSALGFAVKDSNDVIVDGKSTRGNPDFIEFALIAARFALEDSKLLESDELNSTTKYLFDHERAGVAIGNGGIGSLQEIIAAHASLSKSYRKLSPFFVPNTLVNMAAGHVSIKYNLKGPNHSVATACAAGTHSIGDAFNFIRLGMADMMVAGGTEACLDKLSIAGFARMKALSPASSNDGSSSRPFDISRNGFVLAEGAGMLVLEELECVLSSGREDCIIAEVNISYLLNFLSYRP